MSLSRLYLNLGSVHAVAHTVILVYELISLNIAINAFDNSLLTLLLSNQFVEIKGSVFKKFEKDNLFQITCAGTIPLFFAKLVSCLVLSVLVLPALGDQGAEWHVLIAPLHRYCGKIPALPDAACDCVAKYDRVEWVGRRSLDEGCGSTQGI